MHGRRKVVSNLRGKLHSPVVAIIRTQTARLPRGLNVHSLPTELSKIKLKPWTVRPYRHTVLLPLLPALVVPQLPVLIHFCHQLQPQPPAQLPPLLLWWQRWLLLSCWLYTYDYATATHTIRPHFCCCCRCSSSSGPVFCLLLGVNYAHE